MFDCRASLVKRKRPVNPVYPAVSTLYKLHGGAHIDARSNEQRPSAPRIYAGVAVFVEHQTSALAREDGRPVELQPLVGEELVEATIRPAASQFFEHIGEIG